MSQKIVRIYASALFSIQEPHKLELDPKYRTLKPKEETLQDITGDLAVEFKQWPVPEAKFDAAMKDLLVAVKQKMIEKGVLR